MKKKKILLFVWLCEESAAFKSEFAHSVDVQFRFKHGNDKNTSMAVCYNIDVF